MDVSRIVRTMHEVDADPLVVKALSDRLRALYRGRVTKVDLDYDEALLKRAESYRGRRRGHLISDLLNKVAKVNLVVYQCLVDALRDWNQAFLNAGF